MADDPNRDILPVKDDSCYGSVRCSSDIDPRERHMVCKLDRYQLEDRYLRLLEEVQGLKKLSNSQEDKIKRLATKLMRCAASTRTCPAVLAINDEREKIARLELENSRLKDKACTLRNQLLSHRGPRSPSRCRRVPSGISSGPTTYRSESARTKYQSQPRNDVDDNDAQNYLVKIEELETQRNELMTRVTDLENQIAIHVAGIQREKVQDNVEHIRMWRQVKQTNDKLVAVQAANDTLHAQITDLKKLLEETTKNNREVTAALVTEKQKLSEIDDQITSAKDSQLSLREKDERIRDLTNEMKILQQHNNELIALSSKFGQVEVENVELKRKVSEYAQDNLSLKSAFNSEQADHAALRAANDKLIEKIEELQKNMDNLNIQLRTFQNQEEKQIASRGTQTELKQADKKIGTIHVTRSDSFISEEDKEPSDENFQDERKLRYSKRESKEVTRTKTEVRNQSVPLSRSNSRIISNKTKLVEQRSATSPSMSREKILMLLDQAQISTPLEAQNAARMRQIDVAAGQNDASIFPEAYRFPMTFVQRSPNDGFVSTNIPPTNGLEENQNDEQIEFFDPKEMLLTIFEILKSYSENVESKKLSSLKTLQNETESNKKNRAIFYADSESTGNEPTKIEREESIRDSNLLNKFTETMSCQCDSNHRCSVTSDCGYGCCTPEIDHGPIFIGKDNFRCANNSASVKSRFSEIGSSIQKAFDSIYMGRNCHDVNDCCVTECFDNPSEIKPAKVADQSTVDRSPRAAAKELERCKELLRERYNFNSDHKKEEESSNCESNCPTSNECEDTPAFCEISQLPLLVTKDQGLVEIHIMTLQLSAKATQNLFCENLNAMSVFVSLEVWGQEPAFTPILKYKPSLTFDSSSVYRVCELQSFFEKVHREHIVFQVHVIDGEEETLTVAKAKLSVKDILDYPQNKLHYITPVTGLIPCPCDGNFGQLSLWIRLSCDIELIEDFKDRCGLAPAISKCWRMQIPPPHRSQDFEGSSGVKRAIASSMTPKTINDAFTYPELTNPAPVRNSKQEVPEVPENSFSISPKLNKNNRLDTIREAESRERIGSKGRYRYENPVAQWSSTNIRQGNASVTSVVTNDIESQGSDADGENNTLAGSQKKRENGQQIETGSITEFNHVLQRNNDESSLRGSGSTEGDLGAVIADDKWEKYKRSSLPLKSDGSDFENAQGSFVRKNTPPTADTITISIVTVTLFDKTSLMNNPDVDLLYIEYSFLGMHGADMETISIPKPRNKGEVMSYNFTRKFKVDEEYHNSQRNMLIAMLSGTASPIIRFVIVSEPLPEEVDTKECVEVGHADLNIKEYALGDGLRDVPLIIMNPGQSEQFGMLKITIDGIEIIRKCMMVQKRL